MKIIDKINQIRCTITRTPAVLLHIWGRRNRCTITHATGAEINARKLQMSSMYGKAAVPLHIDDLRKNPVGFVEHFFESEIYPWQKQMMQMLADGSAFKTSPTRAQELSKEFLERARQLPVEIQYNTEYGQVNEPAVPLHKQPPLIAPSRCVVKRRWWQWWKPKFTLHMDIESSAVPSHSQVAYEIATKNINPVLFEDKK